MRGTGYGAAIFTLAHRKSPPIWHPLRCAAKDQGATGNLVWLERAQLALPPLVQAASCAAAVQWPAGREAPPSLRSVTKGPV